MPANGGVRVDPLPHLLARIDEQPDGCWLWKQHLNASGYGTVRLQNLHDRHPVLVHRAMYELLVGPIPDGLELDHLCRVRACCNPEHLEPVTRAINIARSEFPGAIARIRRAATHCRHGHEYTPQNTHRRPDGRRRCRACNAAWARRQARAA